MRYLILILFFLFSSYGKTYNKSKLNIKEIIHKVYTNANKIKTFEARIIKTSYYNRRDLYEYKGKLLYDNINNKLYINYYSPYNIKYISDQTNIWIINNTKKYFLKLNMQNVKPFEKVFFINAQKISFNVFYLMGNFFKFKFKRIWKNKIVIEGSIIKPNKKNHENKYLLLIGIDKNKYIIRVVELYYNKNLIYQIIYSHIKKINGIFIASEIKTNINLGAGIFIEKLKYRFIKINQKINNEIFNVYEKKLIKNNYEKITENIFNYLY